MNEAHVPKDVSVDKFQNLVGSILATNYITFTDEEMTPDGTGHVRPLYITVKCKDMIVTRVLIDNGSALNVCPRATLDKVPIESRSDSHEENLHGDPGF